MNTQKMYGRVRLNKAKKGGKVTNRWKRNKKLRGRSRLR